MGRHELQELDDFGELELQNGTSKENLPSVMGTTGCDDYMAYLLRELLARWRARGGILILSFAFGAAKFERHWGNEKSYVQIHLLGTAMQKQSCTSSSQPLCSSACASSCNSLGTRVPTRLGAVAVAATSRLGPQTATCGIRIRKKVTCPLPAVFLILTIVFSLLSSLSVTRAITVATGGTTKASVAIRLQAFD